MKIELSREFVVFGLVANVVDQYGPTVTQDPRTVTVANAYYPDSQTHVLNFLQKETGNHGHVQVCLYPENALGMGTPARVGIKLALFWDIEQEVVEYLYDELDALNMQIATQRIGRHILEFFIYGKPPVFVESNYVDMVASTTKEPNDYETAQDVMTTTIVMIPSDTPITEILEQPESAGDSIASDTPNAPVLQ